MSADDAQAVQRIAARGPEAVVQLLRPAFERQAKSRAIVLGPSQLESLIKRSAARADGVVWRRALAGIAVEELGIELSEAVEHPAVEQAQLLAGAPPYVTRDDGPAGPPPPPGPDAGPDAAPDDQVPQALRVVAVHLGGIETLRAGARDLELRFADAGVDVLVRSTGASIGRLDWEAIEAIEMSQSRRGLMASRRRPVELVIRTDHGKARFELPGLLEAELRDQLTPYLGRTRAALRPR